MNTTIIKHEELSEKTIGDRIRKLRIQHGLTQAQVAEEIDVDTKTYGKYETDTILPPTGRILDLSELYKVTTDYLLLGNVISISEHISSLLEKCPTNKQHYIENIVQELVSAFLES